MAMTRLAIIGLGAAARNIHLPAFRRLGGRVEVVAGCDPDPSARGRAAKTWKLPRVFAEPAEMLDQVDSDWVVVCTPPAMHREHTRLALAAGRHVFCEKPLAESLSDAAYMIAAARTAKRQLVVNNEFPFMACHQAAHAQIGRPEFGRLLFIHASHTMDAAAHPDPGWRGALQRRLGLEYGVHVLDLMRFFFGGDPVRLFAHMPRPKPSVSWDAVNIVALEFPDGRSASLVLDRLSRGPERYLDLRLDGEHAAVHTSLGGKLELSFGLHARARRPFAHFIANGGSRAVLQQGVRERSLGGDGLDLFAGATAKLLGEAIDAVAAGRVPPVSASDNIRSLGLVFAAYDSAASGQPIDVASYLAPYLA
jgi:predicted dehydrogenase